MVSITPRSFTWLALSKVAVSVHTRACCDAHVRVLNHGKLVAVAAAAATAVAAVAAIAARRTRLFLRHHRASAARTELAPTWRQGSAQ